MHRIVGTTFKILMASILLMFLLDTVLVLVEVISIHTRVENVSGLIQTEVARNNCLPDNMADGFLAYIKNNIADRSDIIDYDADVRTNFKQSLGEYESLSEENVKNYGEITTVAIQIQAHPSYVFMGTNQTNSITKNVFNIRLDYVYQVPCLRYLK